MQRTVVVGAASRLRCLDTETGAFVRVAFVFGRTRAFVGAGQIDTVCRLATRCNLDAFIDINTIIVGCDAETSGTNTEAILAADVDALLVMSIAGICCGAIVACPEAVVETTLEIRRTTTITIQTQQISRALELMRATN